MTSPNPIFSPPSSGSQWIEVERLVAEFRGSSGVCTEGLQVGAETLCNDARNALETFPVSGREALRLSYFKNHAAQGGRFWLMITGGWY